MTTATGTVTCVKTDATRRYGFIEPDGPGDDVFFHETALAETLEFDQRLIWCRVRFELETDWRGRLKASNVRLNSAVVARQPSR